MTSFFCLTLASFLYQYTNISNPNHTFVGQLFLIHRSKPPHAFHIPILTLRSDQIILRNLQFQERVRLKEDNQNMQNRRENPRHDTSFPTRLHQTRAHPFLLSNTPPRITIHRYVSSTSPPNPARRRYPRVELWRHTRHIHHVYRPKISL